MIICDSLAWELPRYHIMEDTETVSATRMCMIVSELSYALILWTHIGVCMWANCMDLQVVPVSIAI